MPERVNVRVTCVMCELSPNVCVIAFSTFSNRMCVTGDAKPSPHTVGNIWNGFPRNVLACLWNAPFPTATSSPFSLSLPSRLLRGEGEWKNSRTHKNLFCHHEKQYMHRDRTRMETKPQSSYALTNTFLYKFVKMCL